MTVPRSLFFSATAVGWQKGSKKFHAFQLQNQLVDFHDSCGTQKSFQKSTKTAAKIFSKHCKAKQNGVYKQQVQGVYK